MGFLTTRLKAAPPPTAMDVIKDDEQVPSARALEKHQGDPSSVESVPRARYEDIDPVMEKQVIRKMDLRIVPLVSALYVLAFLDRSNIGNARIAGMRDELHLVGSDYQWLLTIFYITYVVLASVVQGPDSRVAILHLNGEQFTIGVSLSML